MQEKIIDDYKHTDIHTDFVVGLYFMNDYIIGIAATPKIPYKSIQILINGIPKKEVDAKTLSKLGVLYFADCPIKFYKEHQIGIRFE